MQTERTTQEFVKDFARYLSEDGKGLKTVESYAGDVARFLTWLEGMDTHFSGELRRFQITGYRNHLVENHYEPSTVNKKINSIQAFNRWLVAEGLTPETVVDLRRDRVNIAAGSEKPVEVYSERQLERLLFYLQGERVKARDRAIVLVLLFTGVRVSELCGILVRNVDLLGEVKVTGKGGKIRAVPLRPEVADAIRDYLTERAGSKHAEDEHLFLGQRGPLQRDAGLP